MTRTEVCSVITSTKISGQINFKEVAFRNIQPLNYNGHCAELQNYKFAYRALVGGTMGHCVVLRHSALLQQQYSKYRTNYLGNLARCWGIILRYASIISRRLESTLVEAPTAVWGTSIYKRLSLNHDLCPGSSGSRSSGSPERVNRSIYSMWYCQHILIQLTANTLRLQLRNGAINNDILFVHTKLLTKLLST